LTLSVAAVLAIVSLWIMPLQRKSSYFAVAPPYFDTAANPVHQGDPQWGIVHETGDRPGA